MLGWHCRRVQPKINMVKGRWRFSQINVFHENFPCRTNVLLFFPASLISSTYTNKICLFSRSTNKHSQFGTFPNRVPIEFFRIACPTTVLPEDDNTDFAQEERLDLRCWTIISAILCRGRRIQMSGHSDLRIFNDFGASFIFTWKKADTASAAWPGHPGSWRWYPWLLLLSFVMLMILVQWILHKTPNRLHNITSEYNSTFVFFGALPQIQYFSNDTFPSVRRNELLRPSSLLHRSPLSYFWFSSGSTPKFSPIFPIPCPLLLLLKEFSWLEALE